MRIATPLLTIFCIVTQVTCDAPESRQKILCSDANRQKILELCGGAVCDVAETALEIQGKKFCGYRYFDYMSQPPTTHHPSFDSLVQLEDDLPPCVAYVKTSTLFSQDSNVLDGPFRENLTAPPTAPPGVGNLRVSLHWNECLNVTWTPPATLCDVRGYNLSYSYLDLYPLIPSLNRSEGSVFLKNSQKGFEGYQLKEVQENVLYHVCVFAYVDKIEGVSSCAYIRTPKKEPALPRPPEAKLLGKTSSSLTLTWRSPEEGNDEVPPQERVVNYEISVRDGRINPTTLHVVPAGVFLYNITQLSPGIRYRVGIKAVSEIGAGEESVDHFSTEDENENENLLGLMAESNPSPVIKCGTNDGLPLGKGKIFLISGVFFLRMFF